MTYELTSLLTTIAAASASIVAILGGFIASKLISISGERSAVLEKLESIGKEIAFKQNTIDKLQAENDEEDALDFIRNHVEKLFNGDSLESAFDNGERQTLPLEKLQPYWERAKLLRKEMKTEYQGKPQFNKDGIPMALAIKYSKDDFAYSVFEALEKYLEKMRRQALRSEDPFRYSLLPELDANMNFQPLLGSYRDNERKIKELLMEKTQLEFEQKQYELQKQQLKKPEGMKKGLVIFALFSLFCIVLPLVHCPFTTNIHCKYLWMKYGSICLFTIGLGCIFLFMQSLLKWKDGSLNPSQNKGTIENSLENE